MKQPHRMACHRLQLGCKNALGSFIYWGGCTIEFNPGRISFFSVLLYIMDKTGNRHAIPFIRGEDLPSDLSSTGAGEKGDFAEYEKINKKGTLSLICSWCCHPLLKSPAVFTSHLHAGALEEIARSQSSALASNPHGEPSCHAHLASVGTNAVRGLLLKVCDLLLSCCYGCFRNSSRDSGDHQSILMLLNFQQTDSSQNMHLRSRCNGWIL